MALIAVATAGSGGEDDVVAPALEVAGSLTFVDSETGEVREVVGLTPGSWGSEVLGEVLSRGAGALVVGSVSPQNAANIWRAGVRLVHGIPGTRAVEAAAAASSPPSQSPPSPASPIPGAPFPLQQGAGLPWPGQPTIPLPLTPPPEVIERQRKALELSKWILERQLEILDKQREILEAQLREVEERLRELG